MTSLLPEERRYVDEGPRSGPADAVVLDIGGDVGALILYADEALIGEEIDLTAVGVAQHHGVHTAIRRRRAGGRDVVCGVYPGLRAGEYVVWGLDGKALGRVTIVGGRVSELDGGACGSVG